MPKVYTELKFTNDTWIALVTLLIDGETLSTGAASYRKKTVARRMLILAIAYLIL